MQIKTIFLSLALSLSSLAASANNEACKADLSNKFDVSQEVAGDLCTRDSFFIQSCMNEQSEILRTDDFDELSGICIDLLETEANKQDINPLQF
ncbi:MAG: hypothetical protein RJB66_144 [Pseudomonadota bacterium]